MMIGGAFWTKFELSLNKIRKRILNNPAQRLAPPTAGQAKPAKISFSFDERAKNLFN